MVIYAYGLGYGRLFFRCEVKFLLVDRPAFTCVFFAEIIKRHYAHLVICYSENEPQHEKGLAEREDAVVYGHVDAFRIVGVAYRRVAVKAVNLVAG